MHVSICDRRNKWSFWVLSKKGMGQKEEKHEEIYTECMLILLIKFPCRIFRFESPWWLFKVRKLTNYCVVLQSPLIRSTRRLSPGDLRQYTDCVKTLNVGDSTLPCLSDIMHVRRCREETVGTLSGKKTSKRTSMKGSDYLKLYVG